MASEGGGNGSPASRGRQSLAAYGPWFRVLAVPAAAPGEGAAVSAESDFVAILPAAMSAARAGRPFAAGWLSRGDGAPLILVSNAAAGGPAAEPQENLLFPNGARAGAAADWSEWAEELTWTCCPGMPARPFAATGSGSLFESALVALMDRPFGWLVIARPRGEQAVDEELSALAHELRMARRGDNGLPVERAERRMAELDAFREAGLWEVRVLVGAASAAELERIAPVLVGSVGLSHHPYRLRSGRTAMSFEAALACAHADRESHTPFVATAGVMAALTGLPRREVPGVRVRAAGRFDVTAEGADDSPAVELGAILDEHERRVGRLSVPLSTLNRHVFVTGATGSGKSQTVRHMLEQLSHAGIPWLAIEPAKSEYAAMAGRLAEPITVIAPSAPSAVPISVNPLAPEPGFPVQAHIDMVRALFQAAFDAEEPFPQIISQALQRVYEDNGWDVVTGGAPPGSSVLPAVPTLKQLHDAAFEVIGDVGYGKELMADVTGFVDVRLRSLRIGSAGRFFEGGHPADIGALLSRNVVLAIEDVANDEDKAFLMGTLIIRIVEHLRMRARTERTERTVRLRHVIVIEEAHRLLRARNDRRASAHAVELFAGMLAEIRAYGEAIVVSEQIPTKLVPDVVKNTALKIVHRLPAHDDRYLVGSAMNLDDDQSREVVSLPPGVAAVFADGMDRPLRVRMPLGEDREHATAGADPPTTGRRSAGCGAACRTGRPCDLMELRAADLLADDPGWAWLRVWADTLVLAHVVNRPLPTVPDDLRRQWSTAPVRRRECLLATVADLCVTRRSAGLRHGYAPADLTAAVARDAARLLDGADGPAGGLPGAAWVIPQVRWLHELDRVLAPGSEMPDKHAPAPRLDYPLDGLAEPAEPKVGHRIRALRRHRLSMALEHNRPIAVAALVGADGHEEFMRDVDTVAVGVPIDDRIGYVAGRLRVASWLGLVLDWPDRLVVGSADPVDQMPPSA